MAETFRGEVIHVVGPEEREPYELEPEMQTLADSRHILVCRKGGSPSWFERIRSFLLGHPIEAVTIVTETAASEGEEVTATIQETTIAGVYEATDLE